MLRPPCPVRRSGLGRNLSGVVKDSDGNVVSGATVSIRSTGWSGNFGYSATSAADGTYTINVSNYDIGYYVLRAASTSNYSLPYYYTSKTGSYAKYFLDPFQVTETSATTINPVIPTGGGVITGKVTLTDGTAVKNQYAYCYDQGSSGGDSYASTNTEGVFTVTGMPPSTLYVCYTYYNGTQYYYDNATSYSNMTHVTVTANTDTTGIDFTVSGTQSSKVVVVPICNN